mmetsp:Transcript_7415/g.17901  ORF Transcript_7415/g.17901 Transcript_7415/m.17901 type:complete len:214 (+) Transcript_7415:72-713(+)
MQCGRRSRPPVPWWLAALFGPASVVIGPAFSDARRLGKQARAPTAVGADQSGQLAMKVDATTAEPTADLLTVLTEKTQVSAAKKEMLNLAEKENLVAQTTNLEAKKEKRGDDAPAAPPAPATDGAPAKKKSFFEKYKMMLIAGGGGGLGLVLLIIIISCCCCCKSAPPPPPTPPPTPPKEEPQPEEDNGPAMMTETTTTVKDIQDEWGYKLEY